jgi:AAA+ superfamily predicted ATPase
MIPPRDRDRIISSGSRQAKKRAQRRARRDDPSQDRLPPEASITLAAEREATGIDSILGALEEDLIGLAPIKQKVNEIASLLLVDRARRRFGLEAPRPNLHMCFTGSPGTGKTTVALRMASLLHQMGYLEVTLKQQLSRQMEDARFSNARSVRNDLDRARLRHAFRLSAEPDRRWGRDDLMRLEPSDVMDDEPG